MKRSDLKNIIKEEIRSVLENEVHDKMMQTLKDKIGFKPKTGPSRNKIISIPNEIELIYAERGRRLYKGKVDGVEVNPDEINGLIKKFAEIDTDVRLRPLGNILDNIGTKLKAKDINFKYEDFDVS